MKTAAFILCLFVAASVSAQEFQYQFHDKPRPEADVVVVRHSIRQGPGADLYLVGRVFNRGLEPAKNVRVNYTVANKYGTNYPSGTIHTRPTDVPATGFADFEGRLLVAIDPREVFIQAQAHWDP